MGIPLSATPACDSRAFAAPPGSEGRSREQCILAVPADDGATVPENVTVTDLKAHLGAIVEKASRGDRVRIVRHGRTQAAIVSAEDLELLERIEDAADLRAGAKARKGKGKARSLADVLRDLGL